MRKMGLERIHVSANTVKERLSVHLYQNVFKKVFKYRQDISYNEVAFLFARFWLTGYAFFTSVRSIR